MAKPVICGWVVGVVDPPAKKTFVGESASLLLSLLASVTARPPSGAGVDKMTLKAVDWFGASAILSGNVMAPEPITVTVRNVSGKFGGAPARITVVPGPTATIGIWPIALPSG